ncbi:oligosaccharide flippase family protein [Bacillus cereus group sp. Sample62]|uniref:oligosaccharide flippase family protein n=1 Tax=Bacillus cereus group TaxID=86661 RepID=UPI00086EA80E|nr:MULTISPECIES: oligosaccharide flippase family protein [Bacillus cereus group]SCN39961.1 Wzx [Bacillus cereus]HDR4725059.1 oligosaccharide flippase family protein [Bacillus cereus]HDX9551830.1 oligosaccharide flippase family protein [Bacillus thuringiensis]
MKLNSMAVKNIAQMGVIQLVNYLFPLITVPYLLRTIGISNYGILSVEIAVAQILLIISDYGFAFTATQKIAIKEKVDNDLASAIYIVKCLMGIIVFIAVSIIIYVFSADTKTIILHFGFFGFFFFQSLIPNWLFRGLNKLMYISILTVMSKLFTLVLMLLLIKSESDYYLLGIVYAVPTIIICVIAQIVVIKLGVKIQRVSIKRILSEIEEGKDIFLSNIIGVLYTTMNTIVVAFFGGSYAAGIYATCEKVVGLVNSVTNAISQAVYPIVCKEIAKKKNKIEQFKVSLKYFGWWPVCTFIGGIILLVLAPFILALITGGKVTDNQILTLRIMSFIPFLISLGHLLGIQTLIPLNDKASVRIAVTYGAIVNLSLGVLLSWLYEAPGTAAAILLCELVVVGKELKFLKTHISSKEGEK